MCVLFLHFGAHSPFQGDPAKQCHPQICYIPKSFKFLGQILHVLFQMTPLALQAHLQAACEIVSDTTVVLRTFRAALGLRRTVTRDEQCFQQDGAAPHTSRNTLLCRHGK